MKKPTKTNQDRQNAELLALASIEQRLILGAMLNNRTAAIRVFEVLGPDDFYNAEHRLVFEAMQSLYKRGIPINPVTVEARLARNGNLERIGGRASLTSIVEAWVSEIPGDLGKD